MKKFFLGLAEGRARHEIPVHKWIYFYIRYNEQ